MSLSLLLVFGCLERTTGVTKPLPAAYTANAPVGGPADMEHGDGAPPLPFADHDGALLVLSGVIISDLELPVDVDVMSVNAKIEEGTESHGKLMLEGPGPFELQVPEELGVLILGAFQDPDEDGPDETDPYGAITVEIGEDALAAVEIVLVEGGRAAAAEAVAVAPSLFPEHDGEWVTVFGVVNSSAEGAIEVDLRVEDPDAEGGTEGLNKVFLDAPGPFSFDVPRAFGALELVFVQDVAGDGPDPTDPGAIQAITVGKADLEFAVVLKEGGAFDGPPGSSGSAGPFDGVDGPMITLSGTIASESSNPVELDVRVADASAQGGNRALGKVHLDGPGAYTLQIPAGYGALQLAFIQDTGGDGPDPTDPGARADLSIGAEDLELSPTLTVGGGFAAAPGASSSAATGGSTSFASGSESTVTVRGVVRAPAGVEGQVDMDLHVADKNAPGGRKFVGKVKVGVGAFAVQVPQGLGAVQLEAFIDSAGDGPDGTDIFGTPAAPLVVGDDDVSGVVIVLAAQ